MARDLAEISQPGDVLLLSGEVGAGKTTFARAFIQHFQRINGGEVEEVPSPTFTLIQTYAAGDREVWHADLYRLQTSDEIFELGLAEAFETQICLVEWPERLGPDAPAEALNLYFEADAMSESARRLEFRDLTDAWLARLAGLLPQRVRS